MEDSHKKVLIISAALQVLLDCDDDEMVTVASSQKRTTLVLGFEYANSRKGSKAGRVWLFHRNSKTWFADYALSLSLSRASLIAMFRIPRLLFDRILPTLRSSLTGVSIYEQEASRPEMKLASFLMYMGGATCSAVACQLELGPSSVSL